MLVHCRRPTSGDDVHSAKGPSVSTALLRPFPLSAVLVVAFEAERQAGEVCEVPDMLERPRAPGRDEPVEDEYAR